MKKISIFILAIILLQACGTKCPPDEKIGEIHLDNESLSYFPYQNNDTLVFKNAGGDELIMYQPQGVTRSDNFIAIEKLCSEFRYDGNSTYRYYEGIGKSVWFKSDSGYSLNMGLYTENLREGEELFYDKLTVGMMEIGSIGRLELVTKVRFSAPSDTSEFNISNEAIQVGTVQILSHSFTNVWSSIAFDGRIIYFNKDLGVVGFNDGTEWYYLSRIIR